MVFRNEFIIQKSQRETVEQLENFNWNDLFLELIRYFFAAEKSVANIAENKQICPKRKY